MRIPDGAVGLDFPSKEDPRSGLCPTHSGALRGTSHEPGPDRGFAPRTGVVVSGVRS